MDVIRLSVSELNTYVKQSLETDPVLADVWVSGEIANLKYYAMGEQIYFNLSDGQSSLNCVVYSTFIKNIGFRPENGQTVTARGKIKVFHKKGTYTFQVAYLQKSGQGEMSKSFEALKNKLYEEGLFDPARKTAIPLYCRRVGLITAPDSAAMWDFVSIAGVQTPVTFFLIPAVMQGASCASSVVGALDLAEAYSALDAIVVLRGGGSSEDLSGFNDEALVRRVFACRIPVMSAVGHEVDYTLLDFVADFRAATPSAGAQLIAAPYATLREHLTHLQDRAEGRVMQIFVTTAAHLTDILCEAQNALEATYRHQKAELHRLMKRLVLVNPLHKLSQGFSIARLLDSQKVITSVAQIQPSDLIVTTLTDGQFQSKVEKIL